MAKVMIPARGLFLSSAPEVRRLLATIGIDYQRWEMDRVTEDSEAREVLQAYAKEIDDLKQRGGYTTADVIDVWPNTPGLDVLLDRFKSEHTHSEDEVRFILSGRGVFHIRPVSGDVVSIEVGPGDLICVPRDTRHWFNLCPERRIRAIRWFQDTAGWTPQYTHSQVDTEFEAVCFGPQQFGPSVESKI